MKKSILALAGAVALAAPLMATAPAFAADPPGAPAITNAIPGWARGDVILDWDAPATNPAGILGYEIRISSNLGDTWLVPPVNTKSVTTEYTVQGLDPNKSYVFEVRAYNDGSVNSPAGRGEWSAQAPVNPVQPAQNVGPPTYLTTSAEDRAVLVSWIPNDGAAAYQVQFTTKSNPGESDWQSARSTVDDHLRVDGLTAGANYLFRVRSYNGAQDYSDWVTTPNPTQPLGTPNAPTNVSAIAGNASASVTWTAPSGGANSYELQYRAGSGAWSSSIDAR